MIQVIKDKKAWDENLALVNDSDFYFTYDYHHFSKNNNESPILLRYTDGENSLLLPLLIRDIENSNYKDATSVYGYTGVLEQNINSNFEQNNFKKELQDFFKKNNIITVFSRLHPFFNYQENHLEGLGKVIVSGQVVNIDLTDTIENQRAKFNRRLKTYLNKSRKSCSVIKGNVHEHLPTFIRLYYENMKRVDADDSYFFEEKYFYEILASNDFESELSICVHNDTKEIIGGAIFIKTGSIVQYHLSGMSGDHFDLNPVKLIIDEMRIKATQEGFKYFNLGGGRGGHEDSLFRFKSGFSKDHRPFKLWKYIVDEKAYHLLTNGTIPSDMLTANLYEGFFPAYRKHPVMIRTAG
ncbi:GNAT family N-acetyltransferase [Maribacter sp. 2210JD10-5]|uniref:GNAT family N-acetyltransferase n=1 Tax=Maribacter sp. 2210JD10-5 TaxID=3386272 RepID=UPI0039BC3FB0